MGKALHGFFTKNTFRIIALRLKATQKNLLSRQIKDSEYMKLNGKTVQEILFSSEVAMIITIIRNYMVSTN